MLKPFKRKEVFCMFELKKWEPMKELSSIQREMDDFFKRVFGTFSPAGFFKREFASEWYPALNCFYKEGRFIVNADIPGLDPKEIEISIAGNVLTIRGERKSIVDEKKEGYVFHETSYGTFERSMTLLDGVEADKVKASYKNGVLELSMPAKAEALPKKIKVEIDIDRGDVKETKKAA